MRGGRYVGKTWGGIVSLAGFGDDEAGSNFSFVW